MKARQYVTAETLTIHGFNVIGSVLIDKPNCEPALASNLDGFCHKIILLNQIVDIVTAGQRKPRFCNQRNRGFQICYYRLLSVFVLFVELACPESLDSVLRIGVVLQFEFDCVFAVTCILDGDCAFSCRGTAGLIAV